MRERLQRLATRDCNVLITGESGTGKELAAAAIHANSERRTGRMVCINCAAIPDSLVESELFGRERGAFTGADSAQDGKLKAADGGVIFLDEVGDLSLYAQAKILRAVETKEMYRLGSHKPLRVDARIVAATHRNLEEMVQQGLFRQDLFFRLNVGRVHVPPLRDRIEDLHILVSHYLEILNRQMSTCVKGFSEQAWQCLARYSWPGNVRELKNLIESLLVNTFSAMISAEDLPPQIRIGTQPAEGERDQLVSALLAANWNKSKAAERLQWSRMKLYRKMAKYAVSGATGDQVA
jgi:transcriptional regulator with PAS, ATPase and Fis domain